MKVVLAVLFPCPPVPLKLGFLLRCFLVAGYEALPAQTSGTPDTLCHARKWANSLLSLTRLTTAVALTREDD